MISSKGRVQACLFGSRDVKSQNSRKSLGIMDVKNPSYGKSGLDPSPIATCPGICPPEPPLRPVRLGTSKCRLFLKQDQPGVEVLSLADSSGSGFLSFCEPHLMFVASGSRGQPVNAWKDQKTPESLKTKPVCMDRWTDGRMDGWTDGRMDGGR